MEKVGGSIFAETYGENALIIKKASNMTVIFPEKLLKIVATRGKIF